MSITYDLSVHTNHTTTGPSVAPAVTFAYDGDGNRVKKDEDGIVTHYPGRHYESTVGSGSTKYYYAGGQLIAFERSPEYGINYGRRFVFRDHPFVRLRTWLGSTSVIVNDKGEKLWEDRYLRSFTRRLCVLRTCSEIKSLLMQHIIQTIHQRIHLLDHPSAWLHRCSEQGQHLRLHAIW